MARFRVYVSDGLCAALDQVGRVTGASRSEVLAVLIRVHLRQLMGFMGNCPDTVYEGEEVVTVDERGDSEDVPVLDARTKYARELELLVRAFGLTSTPSR